MKRVATSRSVWTDDGAYHVGILIAQDADSRHNVVNLTEIWACGHYHRARLDALDCARGERDFREKFDAVEGA